jgi:hypothetical protein
LASGDHRTKSRCTRKVMAQLSWFSMEYAVRALFGTGDSQHRLNIDLANVFAAWTDTILSVKRPALGIECTVRSFGTLKALRSFSYLSCHSKVISLTFYDQRVPPWSELKLGVLRTQQ